MVFDENKLVIISTIKYLNEFTFDELIKKVNYVTPINTSRVLKILYELLDTRKLIFDGNKFIMIKLEEKE